MYKIFQLKGVRTVHDKAKLFKLGSGLQFLLPYLSFWTVGLDVFMEKYRDSLNKWDNDGTGTGKPQNICVIFLINGLAEDIDTFLRLFHENI